MQVSPREQIRRTLDGRGPFVSVSRRCNVRRILHGVQARSPDNSMGILRPRRRVDTFGDVAMQNHVFLAGIYGRILNLRPP